MKASTILVALILIVGCVSLMGSTEKSGAISLQNSEQVKIFSHAINNWLDRKNSEDEINQWLKENDGKVEIVRVLQSSTGTQFNQGLV